MNSSSVQASVTNHNQENSLNWHFRHVNILGDPGAVSQWDQVKLSDDSFQEEVIFLRLASFAGSQPTVQISKNVTIVEKV